jgi:threonine synthase
MGDLVCRSCRTTYPFDDPRWKCDCGSLLDIRFRAAFDRDRIRERRPTMWRYRDALPIYDEQHIVSFNEGFTPLVEARIHGKPVWLKQEHLFPTGSYKDRGASVLVSRAAELGVSRMVEDSSGNAGAAIAAYAARASIPCDIYVPESTSPAKLVQIRMYGAHLHQVPGSREDTAHAALQAAGQHFYASHVWNPFFFQGTKTFAFEVWEQLGFVVPDTVLIPTGNGTLLIGAYLGFMDLKLAGLIARLPRLIAVQSENCAPLHRMWSEELEDLPSIQTSDTVAEGIAIAEPMRANQIVDIVRETEGTVVTVSDQEIETALVDACRQGWYVEPTSASALAAIKQYPQSAGETIVVPLTGHGLKSTEKLLKLAEH